jgi:hypothetical protein
MLAYSHLIMSSISPNLQAVHERIASAERNMSRAPDEVRPPAAFERFCLMGGRALMPEWHVIGRNPGHPGSPAGNHTIFWKTI